MKNKISLKKLELKINKINDLKANKITGGKKRKTIDTRIFTMETLMH